MKKLICFGLTLFFMFVMFSLQAQDNEIVIKKDTILVPALHDFGTVDKSAEKYYTYKIKNASGKEITINYISAPPGFASSIDKDKIANGETLDMMIALAPMFVSKKGNFRGKISIETNLEKIISFEVMCNFK